MPPLARSNWWSGQWFRFSRYDLRHGRIRPAHGSQMEIYRPWAEYESSRRLTLGTPPYMSLVNFVEELFEPTTTGWGVIHLSTDYSHAVKNDHVRKRIADWSSRHGLLGFLPQRLADLGTSFGGLVGRWFGSNESLTPEQHVAQVWRNQTIVLNQTWPKWEQGFVGTAVMWESSFWRSYGEPVFDWVEWALLFWQMVKFVADPLTNNQNRTYGFEFLSDQQRSAGRIFGIGADNSLDPIFPSLMAMFVFMFVQDLIAHKRLITCALCGRSSMTSAYQAQYCSQRCRWIAQKRRQRNTKRGSQP
jgi:predicted nucleic acid-binding Zn ribbon protein